MLYLHNGRDWIRGSERCLLDLIAGLDRSRFSPVVICDAPALRDAASALGAEAHLIDGWAVDGERLLPSRGIVSTIATAIDRHQVRLVHCNTALPVKATLCATRPRGIPVLAHLHIMYTEEERLHTGLHQVAVAVGVSESAIAGLRADGMPAGRTRVVYNGVDAGRLDRGDCARLRHELGIAPGDLILTAVTSLIPLKGIDVLLDAVARLSASQPATHLILVGDGPERSTYERRARELGVAGRVRFLGEQRDVGAILRDATDIAVSASRWEAFPLNLLEAAYAGVPVIASDIPAHREAVVEGATGLLFACDDAAALARAIMALAGDLDRRALMGRRGAARIRDGFLREHYVARFASIYDELLARSRREFGWMRGSTWPTAYSRWMRHALGRRLGLGRGGGTA